MKRFVVKKYLFAGFFLTVWMLFSVANFVVGSDQWHDLFEDLTEVTDVSELQEWIAGVESELNDELLGNEALIDTYGYVQVLLGKREFNNFAFIQDNEMLYYGSTWPLGTSEMQEYAKRVRRLNEYVEQRGAKLLVVLPPSKILAGVSDVPSNWPLNDPNARMDQLLTLLYQYGVETIDLRVKMRETGLSLDQLFFKTDHHWTPIAGFYAAQEIVDQVKERFGDDWDPTGFYTDLSHYNVCTYFDSMLGSSGRNTGAIYSGVEDYTLLWPNFPTHFIWTYYDSGKVITREGAFTESLLDSSRLEITDLYHSSTNSVYLHEITDKDTIVNVNKPNGPKIKVLRDSYFSPTACFLAPMCSEIDMMWTRASSDEYNVDEFIRDGVYDYFILEIYPYNLDERAFDFFQEPEE